MIRSKVLIPLVLPVVAIVDFVFAVATLGLTKAAAAEAAEAWCSAVVLAAVVITAITVTTIDNNDDKRTIVLSLLLKEWGG